MNDVIRINNCILQCYFGRWFLAARALFHWTQGSRCRLCSSDSDCLYCHCLQRGCTLW